MFAYRMDQARRTLVLASVLAALACDRVPDAGHEFALVGDSPYRPESVPKVEALIRDVNARAALEWVIHVGDTKGGAQPCSDDFLTRRFDLYQGFSLPFVFTPGDNDWFDCGRDAAGGYDDYERLDFIRALYYPDPSHTTGGRSMEVRTQGSEPEYGEFVENVLWVRDDVVYATIHLIGVTRQPTDSAVAARRMDAATAWINIAFEVAREHGSVGVFLATQADPWIVWGLPGLTRQLCEACLDPRPGLESLYPVLVQESTAFAGQVVLAVGDTHIFRVDKPLYRDDGSLVENFTRLETFGEPSVHWVRVTVDPSARGVFSFHQELVPGN